MRMRFLERLESVVNLHRGFHALEVGPVVRKDGEDEDDAMNEVAGDGHDMARVDAGKAGRVPIELEVARAAVDHPAGCAAGAAAPVAFLEQQDRKAAQREIASDAGSRAR